MYSQLLAKIREILHKDVDEREVNMENYHAIAPVNFHDKRCCFVDGGNSLLFDAPHIAIGIIRTASITFFKEKKEINRKESFCVFERNDNKIIATLISDDEAYCNEIYEFDTNKKDENFEECLTIIMRTKEWDLALNKLTLSKNINNNTSSNNTNSQNINYLFLDGTFDSPDQFMKEKKEYFFKKVKELKIPTAGIAKTNTLLLKNSSYTYAVNKHSSKSVWFYPINEEKYIAKFHPSSSYIFVLEGINIDESVFGILQSWSKDPAVLGYPYGLIFADQIARITNEEKTILTTKLSVMLKEDYNKLSHFAKNKDLHLVLDHLQY